MSAPIVQSRHPDLDALATQFAQQGEQVQRLTRQVTQRAEVLRAGGWEGCGKAAFLAEVDGDMRFNMNAVWSYFNAIPVK